MVHISYISFNSLKVQEKSYLICSDDNSMLIHVSTSNLMFLSVLFKLVMCLLDDIINLDLFLLPMGTMICFCDRSLVVMLILGFILPKLLIILCIFSIFFADRLGKFSLIFRISLTLGVNA